VKVPLLAERASRWDAVDVASQTLVEFPAEPRGNRVRPYAVCDSTSRRSLHLGRWQSGNIDRERAHCGAASAGLKARP